MAADLEPTQLSRPQSLLVKPLIDRDAMGIIRNVQGCRLDMRRALPSRAATQIRAPPHAVCAAIPSPVGPLVVTFDLDSLGFSLTGQLDKNISVRPPGPSARVPA